MALSGYWLQPPRVWPYISGELPVGTLVPPFDNGANVAPVSVHALSAVHALMLAVVALKQSQ